MYAAHVELNNKVAIDTELSTETPGMCGLVFSEPAGNRLFVIQTADTKATARLFSIMMSDDVVNIYFTDAGEE